MTDKKEKILQAALELFATEGYNATATSKIAKKAGVSEGLIFRHFNNKKGLLEALNNQVEDKIKIIFTPIFFETNSKEIIKKYIYLPFDFNPEEYNFWRLQFMLKWQNEYYNPDKLEPVLDKLTQAFLDLKYKEPQKEAFVLMQIIESISIIILREGIEVVLPYKKFLLEKYKV